MDDAPVGPKTAFFAPPADPKVRVAWVDIAKGIGIFLVVLGHVNRGLKQPGILPRTPRVAAVDDWIYAFHMPLFFFLSGLFLVSRGRRSLVAFLAGLLGTIAYPYFVWSVLQTLLQSVLGRYTNSQVDLRDLWQVTYQPIMQFWFLYALFLIFVIYVALLRCGLGPWAIFAAFAAWQYGAPWLPTITWGPLARAQLFGIYVALGAALYGVPRFAGMPDRLPAGAATGLFTVGYALIAPLTWLGIDVESPLAILPAVLGIVATIGLAAFLGRLGRAETLDLWGRYSLEIYVAHTIFSSALRIVLLRFLNVRNPAIHIVAGTLAGLYLPILLAVLTRRLGLGYLFRLKMPARVAPQPAAAPRPAFEAESPPELVTAKPAD